MLTHTHTNIYKHILTNVYRLVSLPQFGVPAQSAYTCIRSYIHAYTHTCKQTCTRVDPSAPFLFTVRRPVPARRDSEAAPSTLRTTQGNRREGSGRPLPQSSSRVWATGKRIKLTLQERACDTRLSIPF